MIGAIIGDIVGSRFQTINYKSKEFTLFNNECYFTDDTVMTIAVSKAIRESKGNLINLKEFVIKRMRYFGKLYPNADYSFDFNYWLFSTNPMPYNSYGNGAGMRVSACGFIGKDLDEVKQLAKTVTEVTHNHPEGLKGAEAIAVSIFLAKHNYSKEEIKDYINKYYYKLNFTLDEIRPDYFFQPTAPNSTPQAIQAFLESNSFEDAIRNAISIGGDSDTIAAMTGSIAEAYYGVEESVELKALTYLTDHLRDEYYKYKMFLRTLIR